MKGACQIFYNPSGFNGFLAYLEEPLARFKMDWILFCIYFTINPIYIFISFHQHNHKQRHRRHLLWSCFDGCLSIYVGFVPKYSSTHPAGAQVQKYDGSNIMEKYFMIIFSFPSSSIYTYPSKIPKVGMTWTFLWETNCNLTWKFLWETNCDFTWKFLWETNCDSTWKFLWETNWDSTW